MTTAFADPTAPDAPRWLLPTVIALHAALAAALLHAAAPLVKPALRSLEVALLAPPNIAAPARREPPAPAQRAPLPMPTRPSAPAVEAVAAVAATPAPTEAATAKSASSAPAAAAAAAPAAAAETPAAVAPRFDAAYLNNPRPPYPPLARRMGEEGRTVLRVRVSADGLPDLVELHQSAGSPRLDAAALEAVKRWRFVPARQGDRAVAASVLVPLVFKLEN